jgi:hypothetical protein
MTDDGTQDPVPPPLLADPLSGLVTGSRYEPEPLRVRVTEPPLPDISAVRAAMASVLDDDSELDLDSIGPAADFFTNTESGVPQPAKPARIAKPAEPDTAVAPASEAPAAPASPDSEKDSTKRVEVPTTRQVARLPAPRPGGSGRPRELPRAITQEPAGRRVRLPRVPSRKPKLPPTVKGPSSVWSVTLIMVLLIVMGVLGIVFLASFVDSITSLFD